MRHLSFGRRSHFVRAAHLSPILLQLHRIHSHNHTHTIATIIKTNKKTRETSSKLTNTNKTPFLCRRDCSLLHRSTHKQTNSFSSSSLQSKTKEASINNNNKVDNSIIKQTKKKQITIMRNKRKQDWARERAREENNAEIATETSTNKNNQQVFV